MDAKAAQLFARLDRIPMCRPVWRLVILLSIGGCFEIYDLILTAYISPGLIRSGIFSTSSPHLFGLPDQAAFASATFAGLYIGTLGFGWLSDRYGRRPTFTWALLFYSAATAIMATRSNAYSVDLWRLVAGIGLGVEAVTIDTYITELVPKGSRGRAIAFNQAMQFCMFPVAALLAWLLVPIDPLGVAGWRWVTLAGVLGAVLVWFIRRGLPESPRWLITNARLEEAGRVMNQLEAAVVRSGRALPAPQTALAVAVAPVVRGLVPLFRPPFRRRVIMLAVFNAFQTIGFYGFGNWLPALISSNGASVTHSLQYSFLIAIAAPFGPLLCMLVADKVERKWQIVSAAFGTACFGLLFAAGTDAAWIVGFGVAITLSNSLLSYAYHAYQAEVFPTFIRARAVGFVYSFSRLSTIFTSFLIAFCLREFGTTGVFVLIAGAMGVVIVTIGVFGPRTRGVSLEELSAVDAPGQSPPPGAAPTRVLQTSLGE